MEDKKLELRLGPPGEDNALLSLGYSSSMPSNNNNNTTCGTKRGLVSTFEAKTGERNWLINNNSTVTANSAVPNSSEKRIALAPVVGWPPIRSFRKNLVTSSSSKAAVDQSPMKVSEDVNGGKSHILGNSLFVKINMDGVPIGRKVDLKAYDNYEKLSSAVDELFRGLLAAQRDSSAALKENKREETKAITGLLDGNGEYTLVYEDNEGDRMLVGDVPWHMFLSTAKRLRVLKRSELSSLHISGIKLGKTSILQWKEDDE
uniref:Auxin-responsive protein n=1 Tax=Davidia involucrata TaxID=16924 RepID=A0A5B7B2B6_DAVIN